jgi:PAS domain S-box-containing protein
MREGLLSKTGKKVFGFLFKRPEAKLLKHEEQFRLLADRLPAMVWIADTDRMCVYFNKPWLDFTGKRLDEELGNGWIENIHPAHRERVLDVFGKAFDARKRFSLEYRMRCADGEFRWMLNSGAPLVSRSGEFTGFVGSCVDITDLRSAEETLLDLSGRLINAQEEERSRIARELHDDLSQEMALLSIEVELLAQRTSASAPEIEKSLHEVLARLQCVSSEIHRMSYEIHPSKLDRLGLAPALLSLCRDLAKQQSLQVECNFRDVPDSLPRDVSLCLYRVVQESLSNVLRHSGSLTASLDLIGSYSEICVRVADAGVGFNPESIRKKGTLGLLSMRERLRLVGGRISIDSHPLKGTTVDAVIPLTATDSGRNRDPESLGKPA